MSSSDSITISTAPGPHMTGSSMMSSGMMGSSMMSSSMMSSSMMSGSMMSGSMTASASIYEVTLMSVSKPLTLTEMGSTAAVVGSSTISVNGPELMTDGQTLSAASAGDMLVVVVDGSSTVMPMGMTMTGTGSSMMSTGTGMMNSSSGMMSSSSGMMSGSMSGSSGAASASSSSSAAGEHVAGPRGVGKAVVAVVVGALFGAALLV